MHIDLLDDDQLLTSAEVAELFRVAPKTIWRWAHAGKLPSIRTLGGHRRYRAGDIRRIFDEQFEEATSQPAFLSN